MNIRSSVQTVVVKLLFFSVICGETCSLILSSETSEPSKLSLTFSLSASNSLGFSDGDNDET